MSDTYRKESRKNWFNAKADKPTLEQINAGTLQRIADAAELMAKNHNDLIHENNWLRESRNRYLNENGLLRRKLAAQKGQVTKLKKELENLSKSEGKV